MQNRSMLKILLISATILIAFNGCSSSPQNNKNSSSPQRAVRKVGKKQIQAQEENLDALAIELRDEVTIGREMAAKLCGTFGVWSENQDLEKYIQLLGTSIAKKIGRTEITYYFAILETDEVNAFASPGGYIFITTGLLKHVENEGELVGVLAHEIAHINHKHMFKDIAPKRDVSATESLMKIASKGKSELAAAMSKAVNEGLSKLLEKGIQPEKEFEADTSALEYMAVVGYNPIAYQNFLKRLATSLNQHKSSEGNNPPASISKTHPSFESRVSKIETFISEQGLTPEMLNENIDSKNKRFNTNIKGMKL
jgi:beta-barrel assembly-enhancing protease